MEFAEFTTEISLVPAFGIAHASRRLPRATENSEWNRDGIDIGNWPAASHLRPLAAATAAADAGQFAKDAFGNLLQRLTQRVSRDSRICVY
ncbi:MAG: hypothetical protein OXN84_19960, partial [Albidovulum sp.]|nr:hypothetical protein [Albidovulum sp.]